LWGQARKTEHHASPSFCCRKACAIKTGLEAAKISFAGFLIPFIFVYHPAVLYKLQVLFAWFGEELPANRAMIDVTTVTWLDLGWVIVAFAIAMWLLCSAMTGFEKNRLHLAERVARAIIGLLILVPNMTIALPALVGAVALIIAHRFLNGAPSPIDATPS
jgi:TRAP-type uncharacterized transport system fused permease subunit